MADETETGTTSGGTEEEIATAKVETARAEAEATTGGKNIVDAVHQDQVIADLSRRQ